MASIRLFGESNGRNNCRGSEAHTRETAPGIGSSTLYPLLLKVFGRDNMLGRDKFYALMKAHGLQLKKRRSYRTTNSHHMFRKWKNLIKERPRGPILLQSLCKPSTCIGGVQISMTEEYKPTDNAKAERVNGIIKQLFIDGQRFTEISEVYYALSRGTAFYNNVRPHSSISHEPPSKVHRGEVENPEQLWKSYPRPRVVHAIMENAM